MEHGTIVFIVVGMSKRTRDEAMEIIINRGDKDQAKEMTSRTMVRTFSDLI
jgi:hypothetical protein